jgi:hypothetical protein
MMDGAQGVTGRRARAGAPASSAHPVDGHGRAPGGQPAAPVHIEVLGSRNKPDEIASHIFSALRMCDQAGAQVILMEAIPLSGMGLAVMNRLYRAADNRVI